MYPLEYATISAPTPETISIIITLSGSTSTSNPERYVPAWIHVHAVETWWRSPPDLPRSAAKDTSAPANATKHDAVDRYAAPRRESRVPPSVISSAPRSGDRRQIHAPVVI